jgi:hypothetical protein
VSRGSVISFSLLGSITFLSWRATFKNWLRHAIACGAIHGRRIVMLSTEKELAAVHGGELMSLCGLDEMGRVLLPQNDCSEQRRLHIDAVTEALEHAHATSAEEIILAPPWGNKAQLESVRDRLRLTPLPVARPFGAVDSQLPHV